MKCERIVREVHARDLIVVDEEELHAPSSMPEYLRSRAGGGRCEANECGNTEIHISAGDTSENLKLRKM